MLCVWAICVDGRTGLLSLSATNRESYEGYREVLRDLVKRGMQMSPNPGEVPRLLPDMSTGKEGLDRRDLSEAEDSSSAMAGQGGVCTVGSGIGGFSLRVGVQSFSVSGRDSIGCARARDSRGAALRTAPASHRAPRKRGQRVRWVISGVLSCMGRQWRAP